MRRYDEAATNAVITIIMLGVVVAAMAVRCGPNWGGWHKDAAADNAEAWADEMGIPLDHAVCNARDTDGDGYVSCAFKFGDNVQTFECQGWTLVMPSEGCREPKIRVPNISK